MVSCLWRLLCECMVSIMNLWCEIMGLVYLSLIWIVCCVCLFGLILFVVVFCIVVWVWLLFIVLFVIMVVCCKLLMWLMVGLL